MLTIICISACSIVTHYTCTLARCSAPTMHLKNVLLVYHEQARYNYMYVHVGIIICQISNRELSYIKCALYKINNIITMQPSGVSNEHVCGMSSKDLSFVSAFFDNNIFIVHVHVCCTCTCM